MSIPTEDKPSIAFTEKENIDRQKVEAARIAFQTALQAAYQVFRNETTAIFPDRQHMQVLAIQEAGRFTGEVIFDVINKTPETCFPSVWKDRVDLQQNMYDLAAHNVDIIVETLLDAVTGRSRITDLSLIPMSKESDKPHLH